MPLRVGLIAYPVFVVFLALSKRGTVSKFVQAHAVSPETARKPVSVGVNDPDAVRSATAKKLLIATGDGRFYVDEKRYRARQRMVTFAFGAVGVLIVLLTVVALLPYLRGG